VFEIFPLHLDNLYTPVVSIIYVGFAVAKMHQANNFDRPSGVPGFNANGSAHDQADGQGKEITPNALSLGLVR
jgi:hypothetical protein